MDDVGREEWIDAGKSEKGLIRGKVKRQMDDRWIRGMEINGRDDRCKERKIGG